MRAGSFREGFQVPVAGLGRIVRDPHSFLLTLIPFLIYLLLFALGVYFASPRVETLLAGITSWVESIGIFVSFITIVLKVLAWAVIVVTLAYVIFLVGRVIAAPFHGFMAERILKQTGAMLDEGQGFGHWARLTLKMTLITIIESVVFLLIGIVLFVLSFVPGLNLVAGFAALLIMAFDCADYSFEVLGFGLRRRFRFFFSHFWFFAGLATAMGLTLVIPLLNFVLFPAAVAGSAGAMKKLLDHGETFNDSRSGP